MSDALLVLQISDQSFDEALLIERLVQQWGRPAQVYALTNSISSSLVSSRPERVVGILTENQDENKQKLLNIIEREQISAIIILDLYNYFINPLELNLLPVWLKDLETPIYAVDYFHLLAFKDDQLVLNPEVKLGSFEEGESPLPLDLDVQLLKPVLPVLPEQVTADHRVHLWNPLDSNIRSAAPQMREQLLESIEAKPNSKVITVFFDSILFSNALEKNILGFYFVSIEVLIFYLRQFPSQHFQLLIVGSSPPTGEVNAIPDLNVDIHYFSHITEDNYRTFLGSSDLIIANNNWSVLLLDAMTLEVPVCLLGNSVIQEFKDQDEEEKIITSTFQTDPSLHYLAMLMIKLNKWSFSLPIFQFITYPIPYLDPDFPETGLQSHALPYYLTDMFDDLSTIPIFQNLLFSESAIEAHQAFCRKLLKVTKSAKSFQAIKATHEPEAVK